MQDNPVEKLLWGRTVFHQAGAALQFKSRGLTQRLLHEIKYRKNQELAVELGSWMGRKLAESTRFRQVDALVPVPLHPRKLKLRGYNQSELIAIGMSDAMGVPLHKDKLLRIVHSPSQTRKSRWARYVNTAGAFSYEWDRSHRHVLLVDDVITTGSTVCACIDAMKASGDGLVSFAALACPMN